MDKAHFVDSRKKRYMAQILDHFESEIEPLLDASAAGAVQDFKGHVRSRIGALAADAIDVINLDGASINGAAQAIRDRLSPVGRP